ncbi:hypothetical protein HYH02_008731 [Chlamydomonas schloesseri]|uniref:Uncharacterized protein n=1 Tax=Chlamydomonas schloesseri TaxID=2026947 RepID=A0A835WD93_9CHLO|nr:hypothetical protein HYH02_008731 [Chlamydomonas schloesseri]|eukprot:KAG2445263.1 hypothetical protein HYH02_008731 [Chlamydomonas schloesseri]
MSLCADTEHEARPAKRSRQAQAPGKASARDAESARARDLAAREDAVAAREVALTAREAATTARELAASARETAAVMREEALEAREAEAAAREEEVARREDGARSREETAAMREGAAAAREAAARAREREATAREEAARARIAAAEALERAAALKEQQAARAAGCSVHERLSLEVPVPREPTPAVRQLPAGTRHIPEVPRGRDAPDRRLVASAAQPSAAAAAGFLHVSSATAVGPTAPGAPDAELTARAATQQPGIEGGAQADALQQEQQVEASGRELAGSGGDGHVSMEPPSGSEREVSNGPASGSPLAAGTPPLPVPAGAMAPPQPQQEQHPQQQRPRVSLPGAAAAARSEDTHAAPPARGQAEAAGPGAAVIGAGTMAAVDAVAAGPSAADAAAAAPALLPSSSGQGRDARGARVLPQVPRAPSPPNGAAPRPPQSSVPALAAPAPHAERVAGSQRAAAPAPAPTAAAAPAAVAAAAAATAASADTEPVWGREQNAVLLELLPKKGMGPAVLQEVHERLGGRFGLVVITNKARALMAYMLEEATG